MYGVISLTIHALTHCTCAQVTYRARHWTFYFMSAAARSLAILTLVMSEAALSLILSRVWFWRTRAVFMSFDMLRMFPTIALTLQNNILYKQQFIFSYVYVYENIILLYSASLGSIGRYMYVFAYESPWKGSLFRLAENMENINTFFLFVIILISIMEYPVPAPCSPPSPPPWHHTGSSQRRRHL